MTNIEIRTRSIYNSLSTVEKRVADYFLEHIDQVFSIPIARLAQDSGVSQVAWVRFCKSIGFEGLKDLKKKLFWELNEAASDSVLDTSELIYADIKDSNTLEKTLQTVCVSSIQAIQETAKILDEQALEQAVQLLLNARSIKLFGVGASALVAEDLFDKLLRIGKNVCFCRDLHIQLTYGANLTESDVALFISNSGATQEILEIQDRARKQGCPSISITKFAKNPLARRSTVTLYTSSPEVYRRSGAMSSRIAQLIMVDILFTTIANRDYLQVQQLLENSYESCRRHKVSSD